MFASAVRLAPGRKINELANLFPDVQFVKTYGLTEASTRVSHYFEDKNTINNNCVGKHISDVKYIIVDENDNECKNRRNRGDSRKGK